MNKICLMPAASKASATRGSCSLPPKTAVSDFPDWKNRSFFSNSSEPCGGKGSSFLTFAGRALNERTGAFLGGSCAKKFTELIVFTVLLGHIWLVLKKVWSEFGRTFFKKINVTRQILFHTTN